MCTILQKAYAKINLHLDITEIRQDGFHGVNTVMQTVSLCDTVTLTPTHEHGIFISCDNADVPTGEKNIAWKAAKSFLCATGIETGVKIHIEKRIPMAAGLAGGSADAAAVLRGMNELYGYPLDTARLCEIASSLGADVPFCVVGGSAFADGKGDVLHPFPTLPDCTLLIACGGEGVSTPEAYGMLDNIFDFFRTYKPRSLEELKEALCSRDISVVAKSTFNIFEEPIMSVRPVAKKIKATLLALGAVGAMMSGSGPSVFGIFESADEAHTAAEQLKELATVAVCKPQASISSELCEDFIRTK